MNALSSAALWLLAAPGELCCQDRREATSQAFVRETAATVDRVAESEMKRQGLVGVAVGVVWAGKVVHAQGYGLASLKPAVKADADSVFNWASNSKPLAAVLTMQLVDAGKLDLDADVRTYVPELPQQSRPITTRHLLCHTSGIPHYSNGIIRRAPKPKGFDVMKPTDSLYRFQNSPLLFTPGEQHSYSSYAYVLLSAVIEQAGKQSFADQVRTRVALPLKMKSFQWDESFAGQPHWVKGYRRLKDAVHEAPEEANDWKHGAGGFKSNIRDFAVWSQALANGELLSKASYDQMWTPQKTNDGKAISYGLGFVVEGRGDNLRVAHNGGQPETATRMIVYPKTKRAIVVMTNSSFAKVGEITSTLEKAIEIRPTAKSKRQSP